MRPPAARTSRTVRRKAASSAPSATSRCSSRATSSTVPRKREPTASSPAATGPCRPSGRRRAQPRRQGARRQPVLHQRHQDRVDGRDLPRARQRAVEVEQEHLRERAPADQLLGQAVAADDDLVAVGDRERGRPLAHGVGEYEVGVISAVSIRSTSGPAASVSRRTASHGRVGREGAHRCSRSARLSHAQDVDELVAGRADVGAPEGDRLDAVVLEEAQDVLGEAPVDVLQPAGRAVVAAKLVEHQGPPGSSHPIWRGRPCHSASRSSRRSTLPLG